MRLFVAVALPDIIKQHIFALRNLYPDVAIRFIPEQNLHLTLHFIGDIPLEQTEIIKAKLRTIADSYSAFNLTFAEISPGPKLNSPRLIWVRFRENPVFNELSTALCRELDAAPGAFGKFIPHITIARFRKDQPKPTNLPVVQNIKFPYLPVAGFALWNSVLKSPHPEYTILEQYNFKS